MLNMTVHIITRVFTVLDREQEYYKEQVASSNRE